MSDVVIRVENVSKVYKRRKETVVAVKDLSLDVQRGEVVCVAGASGCGKSTLLNMIAGFLHPTSGKILLDGKPITKIEPRCGMIFQSYALFPWMNVIDNVAFGYRIKGVDKKGRYEKARHWIEIVGLQEFENAYPKELSGGMQQRVSLCRALAEEPDILLCGEQFAALDAMTRQYLEQELVDIVHQYGETVLFITHSIDEALILSDRVVVMSSRPGRVKTILKNDLPRPRTMETKLDSRFLEMRQKVWEMLREEVVKSIV